MVGPYIPTWITGACIIVLVILTATGLVQPAAMNIPTAKEKQEKTQINMDINHLFHLLF
ncbi:MAG: hypothetical protein ACLR43_02725 [Faecalibacillus faecis]